MLRLRGAEGHGVQGFGPAHSDPGQITQPRAHDRARERPGRTARSGLLGAALVNLRGLVDLEVAVESVKPSPRCPHPSALRRPCCPSRGPSASSMGTQASRS